MRVRVFRRVSTGRRTRTSASRSPWTIRFLGGAQHVAPVASEMFERGAIPRPIASTARRGRPMALTAEQLTVVRSSLDPSGFVQGMQTMQQASKDATDSIVGDSDRVVQSTSKVTRTVVDSGSSYERVKRSLDPAYASAVAYGKTQDTITRAVQNGRATQDDANRLLEPRDGEVRHTGCGHGAPRHVDADDDDAGPRGDTQLRRDGRGDEPAGDRPSQHRPRRARLREFRQRGEAGVGIPNLGPGNRSRSRRGPWHHGLCR